VSELQAHQYAAVSQVVLHGQGQQSWVTLAVAEIDATLPWTWQQSASA